MKIRAAKDKVTEIIRPQGESYMEQLWAGINEPIDEYCERTDHTLLSEPINAITNFCIIFAGLVILRMYQRDIVQKHGKHYPMFVLLIILVISLGLGSLAWHLFANVWSLWADLVPIIALILVYQWAVLRLIFRWSRKECTAYIAAFILISVGLLVGVGDKAFNGSVIYLPAVSALCWFGWRMQQQGKRGSEYMGAGVLVFLLAIFLRTIDHAVCDYIPIGTHYFWHVLNSVLVWFLAKALILGYVGGLRRKRVQHHERWTM